MSLILAHRRAIHQSFVPEVTATLSTWPTSSPPTPPARPGTADAPRAAVGRPPVNPGQCNAAKATSTTMTKAAMPISPSASASPKMGSFNQIRCRDIGATPEKFRCTNDGIGYAYGCGVNTAGAFSDISGPRRRLAPALRPVAGVRTSTSAKCRAGARRISSRPIGYGASANCTSVKPFFTSNRHDAALHAFLRLTKCQTKIRTNISPKGAAKDAGNGMQSTRTLARTADIHSPAAAMTKALSRERCGCPRRLDPPRRRRRSLVY
jgi:hypothetical protein